MRMHLSAQKSKFTKVKSTVLDVIIEQECENTLKLDYGSITVI